MRLLDRGGFTPGRGLGMRADWTGGTAAARGFVFAPDDFMDAGTGHKLNDASAKR